MSSGTSIGSIDEVLATRVKRYYPYRINFDSKKFDRDRMDAMTAWCRITCEGRWQSHTTYAQYFQFEIERDALLFSLKFS